MVVGRGWPPGWLGVDYSQNITEIQMSVMINYYLSSMPKVS